MPADGGQPSPDRTGLALSAEDRALPLEVVVVGSGPAAPQPDTPGSGILLRFGRDTVMIDCGPGTMSRLRRTLDPRTLTAVVVTHFHADHYFDIVALRYLFPWRADPSARRLPVYVPPGGLERLAMLAEVISERPDFFSEALDVQEFEPEVELCAGSLRLTLIPSRHYVPAWGVSLTAPNGARVVYSGDTGPNPGLVSAARGADLLIAEATLARAEDDVVERGHLALDEAMDHARRAGVHRLLVTHYASDRRAQIREAQTPGLEVIAARPGLRLAVHPAAGARRGRPAPGGDASRRCPDGTAEEERAG